MRKKKILLFIIVLALFVTIPVYADTLKKGSTGTSVKNIQIKLINEGYLNSKATGYYGNLTKEAIMKFQAKNGLKVDGIAGNATQNALQKIGTSILANTTKTKDNPDKIKEIQTALKNLNFYKGKIDGISGPLTDMAIKNFQKSKGLVVDGIVGTKTLAALFNEDQKIASTEQNNEVASRGNTDRKETSDKDNTYGEMLDWWTEVQTLFPRGAEAKVIDLWTGKSINIKRSYGGNHADCETLTKEDTKMMKEIWGGEWSWNRRPVIVIVGERRIAASMIGMPHAGLDAKAANIQVKGRSGGFGSGVNLDTVKGNGMNGHFCIHFLNSRTHGTNKVDAKHQKNIKIAAGK